ncbi:MAG: 6,7-dimethyl-8-ribityllumazine synthase [Dehalococcoidia bacterium]
MPTAIDRFAFVQGGWHKELTREVLASFLEEMACNGIQQSQIDTFEVPGSFEIPLQIKRLSKRSSYSAFVAAGLIVDGGIYRHEFVAQTVVGALMQLQLELDAPILSVVLTPHHFHEHDAHTEFFRQHLKRKGVEAAHACIATVRNLAQLST